MNRRTFLATAAAAAAVSSQAQAASMGKRLREIKHPLAITMWDFSWLERRWPGAGYEDWDRILDGLVSRGYNAVRIDPYPHLVAADPHRVWTLIPVWNVQDWGSPAKNRVQVQPALNEFIKKCAERQLRVALSTWFRQDTDNTRMQIHTPEDLGRIWKTTLDSIAADHLTEHLLYVDLCNEFPLDIWAPFLPKNTKRSNATGVKWMRDSIQVLREAYPNLDYTFSQTSEWDTWQKQDVSMLDFMELHIWMASASDFYDKVGYHYEKFSEKGYENLVDKGQKLYESDPGHWKSKLKQRIQLAAEWSRRSNKPLITTECWSVVDYKDWPLLKWGWIKDLCKTGVENAAVTGRWVSMATSNFCGPQFAGMWPDLAWHKQLTNRIHSATVNL
ncbi:MAG: cellulase-like family protein [Bryobacteraceae bacterium]